MGKEKKTPVQLATPSDLSDKGRDKIAAHLNPVVANAFALYVKTKSFHWHLSGMHFRNLHLFFDELAEQIFGMIDALAERVRKLGKTTICSVGHIARLQSIEDEDAAYVEPKKMLQALLHDHQQFLSQLRLAHDVCSAQQDVATTSQLEIYIDETERRIWFLFEHLA